MMLRLPLLLLLTLLVSACSLTSERGTLAQLKGVELELKDEDVGDGLERAMQSYREFLANTPESAMTPEAIRRLADLTIEKEYDYEGGGLAVKKAPAPSLAQPKGTTAASRAATGATGGAKAGGKIASVSSESDKAFEKRMAKTEPLPSGEEQKGFAAPLPEGEAADLGNANAEQAIRLYKKLLKKYPLYERNDQVLYQMSRAYEELGQVETAMEVMNRLVSSYPNSHYMDEVQFRRAEYFFTRKKYLDAEEAYQSIVQSGSGSRYYELSLYKLGWSFYKQEMYEDALHKYFALLDHKVMIGYDFEQKEDQGESKRIEDTYRVISLSFSNLGGPEQVTDYFARYGKRSYEDKVYSQLGEFYLTKRRYNDAAASYKAFIDLYAYHEVSPHFNMRVIEIYKKGGFAKLVVESKKQFASTYALDSEYWNYFDIKERPDVVGFLKSNLKDLANHYHALYQEPRFAKDKAANYAEALQWYRSYLSSFPQEVESPAIHYQMADLMLENKDFGDAAQAYEYTSYNYPAHEKSSAAGYAAVYAYREHLKIVSQGMRGEVKQQIIRSSLKFADTYPQHEKVTIVLGAAADDLYEMKNFELAVKTAHKLIDNYPKAEPKLVRAAWLVVGHGSFDLANYADAEVGYSRVLAMTTAEDASRPGLLDNLAASIYKQGEQANLLKEYKVAADHFLRVGKLAPGSKIRATAEYDAAAALMQLEDWGRSAEVLLGFRKHFPNHELQHEVTKKIAYVYRADGKLEMAAAEYERIEGESKDEQVRRGALILAAELYQESGASRKELVVYNRFVGFFPRPVEPALEIYSKMAAVYKNLGEMENRTAILKKIIAADNTAGDERNDRTRYLAAQASLEITEPLYERFTGVKLVNPLKPNLLKKKGYMKDAVAGYTNLLKYEVGDVTAAVTYYLAEIYYHFSRALAESERPTNLNDLEMEQYELALEEQIFPFEEKAIDVHKKNIELLHGGISSSWIDKSIERLAKLYPAAYARSELSTGFVENIDSYSYVLKRELKVDDGAKGQPQGEAPAAVTEQTSAPETIEQGSAAADTQMSAGTDAVQADGEAEAAVAAPAPAEAEAAIVAPAPTEAEAAVAAPAPVEAEAAVVAPAPVEAEAPAAAPTGEGEETGEADKPVNEEGAAAPQPAAEAEPSATPPQASETEAEAE